MILTSEYTFRCLSTSNGSGSKSKGSNFGAALLFAEDCDFFGVDLLFAEDCDFFGVDFLFAEDCDFFGVDLLFAEDCDFLESRANKTIRWDLVICLGYILRELNCGILKEKDEYFITKHSKNNNISNL